MSRSEIERVVEQRFCLPRIRLFAWEQGNGTWVWTRETQVSFMMRRDTETPKSSGPLWLSNHACSGRFEVSALA